MIIPVASSHWYVESSYHSFIIFVFLVCSASATGMLLIALSECKTISSAMITLDPWFADDTVKNGGRSNILHRDLKQINSTRFTVSKENCGLIHFISVLKILRRAVIMISINDEGRRAVC